MENEFSYRTRAVDIGKIRGKPCDVLIVGGGITGAGAANILAANGISVILVEKGDFASGTSSGSSKLIHGGLRYLAQGEITEVRGLLKERDYLTANTSIVKPMDFHILVDQYSWRRGTLRFGLFLYNLLSGKISIPKFVENKGVYPKSVQGYFQYHDSYTDDSLLVVSNIVTAKMHGAICLNYVEATDFSLEDQKNEVTLLDHTTGEKFTVEASMIINAAGPWAGVLSEKLDLKLEQGLKLSKGVHLVVPYSKIPVKNAIAFRSHIDKRQMFIIPRGEVVHIGTTDTFTGDPDDFTVNPEDVDYIVRSVAQIFPSVAQEDVITAYCGIRPLFGEGKDPGTVTRDFELRLRGRVMSILGGKITNYRSASRDTALRVSVIIGKPVKVKGLPVIEYKRPELDLAQRVEYEIYHECPIYTEDIMRRREAARIYSLDMGKSIEPVVMQKALETGMVKG